MKLKVLSLIVCTFIVIPTHIRANRRQQAMVSFYTEKKVLVTGGCGFIGSHIVHTLVDYGAQVTILDDLSTGCLTNIAPVRDAITFIQGCITNPDTCLAATKDQDIIFHLAAFISVPLSMKDPQTCHQINIDGTFNLLEAARINKVKRFIFSSSSAVYGTPNGPCSETSPCHPESPYGFSKLIGEYLCKQYTNSFGLEAACLRYFNVYGERQNPKGHYAAVVAKFKDLMLQDKPVTIFGDGQQTRDFIPVEKVAEANLMMGMLPAHLIQGQVFNVATGKSITLLELFKELKNHFPSYAHAPTFAQARAGDIKHSAAICDKLHGVYANLE